MDRERLAEVAAHYVALFFVLFLVLFVVQRIFGEMGFWIELAIVLAIASVYRPIVLRLGIAPRAWKERANDS